MRIKSLFGKHAGHPVYVVGTGPSLRVFPLSLLDKEVTIGLNAAWKHRPLTYSITVHPEHIVEYERKPVHPTLWLTKPKPPMENLTLDDPRYFVFRTRQEDYACIAKPVEDQLFLAHGIHNTAMVLAAYMGASVIILVGCDMCSLADEHHGHDQHVRFHGLAPDAVYREYRRDAAKVRKIIREAFKIPVLTLNPFLGADHGAEDYARLKKEYGLSNLPPPKDTSGYSRR